MVGEDVVAHADCLMALLVAAVRGEQTPDNIGIEELNEVQVAQKRRLDGAETMVITSSTADFLAWSTTRLPWQQLVSIEGDRDEAARFLNAINLI